MTVWEQLLIAFGGNAMLLVVLGFLARSLLQTWLTKDIKRFETDLQATASSELEHLKAELKAKGDASIEELKNRLQLAAVEHQVRFTNLHEKRAEVIAELYRRAVEVRSLGAKVLERRPTPLGAMGENANRRLGEELYATAEKAMTEFHDFFEIHRIYFPERVCTTLNSFIFTVGESVVDVYLNRSDYMAPGFSVATPEEQIQALTRAYREFKEAVPETLKVLEDEFRTILGVERPHRGEPPH